MFRRVLIANRGEISRRIIRTLRVHGIDSVAVYSDADAGSPYVREADMAVHIGPAEARKSYLDGAKILDVARATSSDAIHPGYGFLSENAEFARACHAAGVTFIGPSPESIESIGDKSRARITAAKAGVGATPGHNGGTDAELERAAAGIGFPLLVKAAAGGGGKGMRRVDRPDQLKDAIAGARREAESAFGSSALILEKYVEGARHVEVQLLGDKHGNVVALLERDCTLQRRHQKIIEECPSPAVTPTVRARLLDAAERIARAVSYYNAGTCEFLLAPDGSFYFLEMNTRLQVEHPVTELVTGLDLVAWQLRIAAGERLSLKTSEIVPHGHAIEARVYAEDPYTGFLPQVGPVRLVAWPDGPGIRVDTGVTSRQEITPFYDPMLAKVIAHGADREEARLRLKAALEATAVVGIGHNVAYLVDLLGSEAFRSAQYDTTWVERAAATNPLVAPAATDDAWMIAVAAQVMGGFDGRVATQRGEAVHTTPWDVADGFRITEGG